MTEGLFGGFVESRHGRVGCGHGVLALSRLHGVVLLSIVVGIEELLKPLDKLKVVLELPLHQFVYWNDLKGQREENQDLLASRYLSCGFFVGTVS